VQLQRCHHTRHWTLHSETDPSPASVQFLEGLSGWQRRWTIVGLCFVAFMLCNMDRVNMSVAILPMTQEYNWTSTTVGLVQSSFFW
jgi:ACS family sodium-dependent inorganic phosphate cotransporter